MKKSWLLFMLIAAATGYSLFIYTRGPVSPERQISAGIISQVDSLSAFTQTVFIPAVKSGKADGRQLRQLFLRMRILYKRFEWAAEYFTGSTSRFVNGPPVEEIGFVGPLVQAFRPEGLQVIEALLFPRYDTTSRRQLLLELEKLTGRYDAYRAYYSNIPIANWQVFDASKLEVFRVLTLGITGFDDPLSLNSMEECAAALESLEAVLSPYAKMGRDDTLVPLMDSAIAYLRRNKEFNSFDRASFITFFGNRLSSRITGLEKTLNVPEIRYNRLLRQDARTLFDSNAFDVNAFAPGPEYFLSKRKIALGKRLFADNALSGTGTRSCASCHQPARAFTDGLKTNTSIHGGMPLPRNTPTLINAALQASLFYDLRATTLEEQIEDVVSNKNEMHGNLITIARQLSGDSTYQRLFAEAFHQGKEAAIDTFEVANAIASYVRSLTRLNSRFDEYMAGDRKALSTQEIKGFNLFMGKARCATCHYMPLFNGTAPPKYFLSDAEVIGVPAMAGGDRIDPDSGWYNVVKIPAFLHAFKTPTVRNAGQTAPYMHNGVFRTLEEVMDFYNDGGGAGTGLAVPNQTLSEDSLHLSPAEIGDVIAFIKSLDSR
jgi:cytochrome c peroxidase